MIIPCVEFFSQGFLKQTLLNFPLYYYPHPRNAFIMILLKYLSFLSHCQISKCEQIGLEWNCTYHHGSICVSVFWVVSHHCSMIMRSLGAADQQQQQQRERHNACVSLSHKDSWIPTQTHLPPKTASPSVSLPLHIWLSSTQMIDLNNNLNKQSTRKWFGMRKGFLLLIQD